MKLLTALIAVYLSTAPACAHDHNHPELKSWFEGLQSGRGMCCDGKDALHLSDVDWGWQNKEDSHIRVRRDPYEKIMGWLLPRAHQL